MKTELRERILQTAKDMMPLFVEVREFIYDHAELGNQEFVSSQYLVDQMKKLGFTVTYPYCDLATAFRAELVLGEGPKVCFMAEYDALPGYGPAKDQVRHACGHNWIAASTLGAAAVLASLKDTLSGTVVLIGTPAEETMGGKCDLVNRGGFDDIDACFQMHLGAENNIEVTSLAMDSVQFDFTGKAAHAAAYPEQGINALDAVMLTFAGINALRQHMKPDARVHGIVTKGGTACNVVPDQGQCQFYIRAAKRAYLEELTEKIINCAKGAALMTGCELEYHFFENSYDDLVYHEGLRQLLRESLESLGVTHFIKPEGNATGSTDVGNVSHRCPTVYCELDTGAFPKVYAHHESFLDYVHTSRADHSLLVAVQAMALAAASVMQDPSILQQ